MLSSVMAAHNITDYEIQALVDGETGDQEAIRLMDVITKDPALLNRYLIYKKQKNLLKFWWKDN